MPFPIIGILLVLCAVLLFATNSVSAACLENIDWPDAPCMDQVLNGYYLQDQVDYWANYYDFKGSEAMEKKRLEMLAAIESGQLEDWIVGDETSQNRNVWMYYYFHGEAPNPFGFSAGFEPISRQDGAPKSNAGGGAMESEDGPIHQTRECPLTHRWDADSQDCEIDWNSILVAGPLMASLTGLTLAIPYAILKKKKIPARRYMLVIAAGILIFFGSGWLYAGLSALLPERFEQQADYRIVLIGALIQAGIGTAPVTIGIFLLKKANLGLWRRLRRS